jgi:hypothetical protein
MCPVFGVHYNWQMVDEIKKEIIKSSNLLILYPIEGPEVECES